MVGPPKVYYMEEHTCANLAIGLLVSAGGFYLGLTTRSETKDPGRLGAFLLRHARICGWIIGALGLLGSMHLLLILLGYMSE